MLSEVTDSVTTEMQETGVQGCNSYTGLHITWLTVYFLSTGLANPFSICAIFKARLALYEQDVVILISMFATTCVLGLCFGILSAYGLGTAEAFDNSSLVKLHVYVMYMSTTYYLVYTTSLAGVKVVAVMRPLHFHSILTKRRCLMFSAGVVCVVPLCMTWMLLPESQTSFDEILLMSYITNDVFSMLLTISVTVTMTGVTIGFIRLFQIVLHQTCRMSVEQKCTVAIYKKSVKSVKSLIIVMLFCYVSLLPGNMIHGVRGVGIYPQSCLAVQINFTAYWLCATGMQLTSFVYVMTSSCLKRSARNLFTSWRHHNSAVSPFSTE